MTDGDEEGFLAAAERLALKMVPEPLRKVATTPSPGKREYGFADAPGFRVRVALTAKGLDLGIALEGPAGRKMFGNLRGSKGLLEQTLGKGLQFREDKGSWWIGETIPIPNLGARVAEAVARRLATYILYFKPMVDDLGSRA